MKEETATMASIDEQILKATKEIIVKFIEGGRLSPTGFHDTFTSVYQTVAETVKGRPNGAKEKGEESDKQ